MFWFINFLVSFMPGCFMLIISDMLMRVLLPTLKAFHCF